MRNTCLRSEGGGLLGGRMEKYFVSVHGIKLGLSEGYIVGTLVSISVEDTGVVVLGQENMI